MESERINRLSRRLLAIEEDGNPVDPELEEEFLSRGWKEASEPLKGGRLKWQKQMGHWGPFLGSTEAGPDWFAKATDIITYRIWATRTFNENWGGDYYTYEFNPVCIVSQKPKKGKKPLKRSDPLGGGFESLAEAQKVCEDHFRENFGD